MGNKNDYLTLEESARMIGRPDSFLKALMSEGKLGAKLAGGRWWISVRDLEELRQNLPLEPEKVVHNFLSDPSERPQRNSTSQVASRRSDTRTGANKNEMISVNRRGAAVTAGTKKQRRIRDLEREISRMRPALERIIQKRQKLISQGRVPNTNKPSKELLQKWRRLQDELDRLQGKPRWDRHIKRKSTSKKSENPSKKGRNSGGIKGYYAGPGGKEKRYWFNEED